MFRTYILQKVYQTNFAIVKIIEKGETKPVFRVKQKFFGFWVFRNADIYSTLVKAESELRKTLNEAKKNRQPASTTIEKIINIED